MRVRRLFALLGAVALAGGCFMLYLMMDLSFPTKSGSGVQEFHDVSIQRDLNTVLIVFNRVEP